MQVKPALSELRQPLCARVWHKQALPRGEPEAPLTYTGIPSRRCRVWLSLRQPAGQLLSYKMAAKLRKYLQDQAACKTKIKEEWLLWPLGGLARPELERIEAQMQSILGSASAFERITTCGGAVVLFWCASPNEQQREQIEEIDQAFHINKRILPITRSLADHWLLD